MIIMLRVSKLRVWLPDAVNHYRQVPLTNINIDKGQTAGMYTCHPPPPPLHSLVHYKHDEEYLEGFDIVILVHGQLPILCEQLHTLYIMEERSEGE